MSTWEERFDRMVKAEASRRIENAAFIGFFAGALVMLLMLLALGALC